MSRNPCKYQLLNWGHSGLPYTNHSSVVVQFLNYVWLSETPWTAALQASQSFTISQSLLKLIPIESVMPSNHLLLCLTPFSFCPQSFPASESFPVSWLFTPVGQWCWNFSFSVSLSSEYSGLISFGIDWFDLAVQRTPKSLLQHHSSKTSILQRSALWSSSHIRTCESCSVMSNSLQFRGLYSPWNSPGQNNGVGSLSLLQGIFPTQGSNPGLLDYRQILYQLEPQGKPPYPYMTGKTIASTRRTFVSKEMSLLFNMLSRFIIAFLLKEQVSFHFMAAVTVCSILEPKKIKYVTVSTFSSSICHGMMGHDVMILIS